MCQHPAAQLTIANLSALLQIMGNNVTDRQTDSNPPLFAEIFIRLAITALLAVIPNGKSADTCLSGRLVVVKLHGAFQRDEGVAIGHTERGPPVAAQIAIFHAPRSCV